jgi:hypothetical protein
MEDPEPHFAGVRDVFAFDPEGFRDAYRDRIAEGIAVLSEALRISSKDAQE